MPSLFPPWKTKTRPSNDHSSPSQMTSISPAPPKPEGPTSDSGVKVMPLRLPAPLPTTSITFATNPDVTPPEMRPAIDAIPEKHAEARDAVKDGAQVANMSRGADVIDHAVAMMQRHATPYIPIVKDAVTVAGQTDFGKATKEGINKFFEGMPVFMNALDELKSLYPFIGVVVLAFKTVYALEQKRRSNNKKVISLFVGMKDMMGVLLILKSVKSEIDELSATDGISIEDRLKSLVERTADDIKACSNVCDAYMKKRLLAKVLLGSVWDAKLLDFVKLFAERRQEFEFELTIHTNQGVSKATAKLDAVGDTMKDLSEQMNVMRSLFQQLVSPEQKRLSELVAEKGGTRALRNNDKVLLDLEKSVSKSSSQDSVEGHRTRQPKLGDGDHEVDNLRNDIFEDPNTASERNWIVFARKFEAQKNQIIDKLTLVIQREGDRVIREVRGIAHDRIRDRSIHEIWEEMGWRGNVKARHFVLSLRDHYLEKLSSGNEGVPGFGTSTVSYDPDAWAIKFIDLMWVQPILEAFDDDASGFITITEVNTFTSSRPVGWSLPHWLAFWAVGGPKYSLYPTPNSIIVGFKWSMVQYAWKIEELFAKMESVRTAVLPPNRGTVDDYFSCVWETVHTLTSTVLSLGCVDADYEKFTSYLEAEEARLGNNLQAVDYVIDGIDTLALVTGGGRIEKTIFPLLYLLMNRHYEIMRIMRTKIVNPRDLVEGESCILYVQDVITYRVEDLTNIFTQQRLDPEKQFQSFAHGVFKYFYNYKALWTVDYVQNLNPGVIPYDDENEDQNLQPGDVLNYEYKDELSLDNWVYDKLLAGDIQNHGGVELPLKDFFGHWHGYFYDNDGVYRGENSMMTFVLVSAEGERNIKANGWSIHGRYVIAGSWSNGENDVVEIKFKMSFDTASLPPIFFDGHLDTERDALTGVWEHSTELDNSTGKVEFRRIPPRYLAVYPSIKVLSENKPRALWRFTIASVQNDIRRKHWSWSYFSQRRDDRENVIPLLVRSRYFGPLLSDQEKQALCAVLQRLTPADACLYQSKANYIRANTCVHRNAACDSCGGFIGGARLFCLDCIIKDTELHNTVDLCTAPQCIDARITDRQDLESAHEPTHRLVKARVNVMLRNYGRAHTRACKAFEHVREICMKIAESSSHSHEATRSVSVSPRTEAGVEPKWKWRTNAPDTVQDQVQGQDQNLPTCGKCEGSLSFPFWYCTFCQDDLFICNACDAQGVPELERSSGRHTEGHHLIRCLKPKKTVAKALATEQRLTAMEYRLDGMQSQLDVLSSCMGDLTGYIKDLHTRVENIEQLLRLEKAPERASRLDPPPSHDVSSQSQSLQVDTGTCLR